MAETNLNNFSKKVEEVLIRHKSILDLMTKLEESNSKINRAIVKSVTDCGCININAKKQEIPQNISYKDISRYMSNHVGGDLCPICKEKIIQEMGEHLFYFIGTCNSLGINSQEILDLKLNEIETLGKYSLL